MCVSKEPRLHGVQDRTNPFPAVRVDKSAMRPFAKLLWTLVTVIVASAKCTTFVVVVADEQTSSAGRRRLASFLIG